MSVSHADSKELDSFQTDPGAYIQRAVKEYVLTSSLNRMADFDNKPFFGEPILAFADGDSQVFRDFPNTVAETHLLPREILERQIPIPFKMRPGFEIEKVSVIAGALPVNPEVIRLEAASQYGSTLMHNYLNWRGGHWGFLKAVSNFVEVLIYIMGHNAVAPFFSPLFHDEPRRMAENCRTTVSNWSERHVAEACGLGTFGLNGMIITEKGMAVNLFSLVCDLEITPSPRPAQHHCLYYRDGSCMVCLERCQNGAIDRDGRNPRKCHEYAAVKLPEIMKSEGVLEDIIGIPTCGLCIMGVPCSDRIP